MKVTRLRMPGMFLGLVLLAGILPSSGAARVRPGFEVGVNYSSLSYDDVDPFPIPYWDRGWRLSFTGGATLNCPVRGRLAVVTGLRYVQQGNRVEYNIGPGAVGEFRVVQSYLSMPVLVECRPLPSQRFFLSLGPEAAVLLSGRLIVEASSPPGNSEYDDIKDVLESGNLSLDAGAGFEFPMENHLGVVSLRYTHGLTGVAKEDHWVTDWKTRGVELLAGMRW